MSTLILIFLLVYVIASIITFTIGCVYAGYENDTKMVRNALIAGFLWFLVLAGITGWKAGLYLQKIRNSRTKGLVLYE